MPLGMPALDRDRFAGACIAAFGVWVAWESRAYPLGTLAEPGPGFLPCALALLLAAFGLTLLAAGPGRSATPREALDLRDAPHAALLLAVLGAGALAIERVGYRIAIALMLVVLLGILERRPAHMVAIVAAGFAVGSFYLLNDLLRVPLPVGPWGW